MRRTLVRFTCDEGTGRYDEHPDCANTWEGKPVRSTADHWVTLVGRKGRADMRDVPDGWRSSNAAMGDGHGYDDEEQIRHTCPACIRREFAERTPA